MIVYQIVNEVTLDRYVGSSIYLNKYSRINNHTYSLRKNIHPCKKMQQDFNKLGIDKFSFEIIEYYNQSDRDFILAREQHYLDILKPTYNRSKSAYNTLGVKYSQEVKDKMKAANHIAMAAGKMFVPTELRRKRSLKYFSENPFKEEVKRKLGLIKQQKKIYCYERFTLNLIKIFDCRYDCQIELGCSNEKLDRILQSSLGTHKNWVIKSGDRNPLEDFINYKHDRNLCVVGVFALTDLMNPLRVYGSKAECAKQEKCGRNHLATVLKRGGNFRGLIFKQLNDNSDAN